MKIEKTPLHNAYTFEIEPIEDERGFFARTFCAQILSKQNVPFNLAQCNIAHNTYKNTIRGLHFQTPPYEEEKIVTCINGAIYDVIVDMNSDSPTCGQWFGVELSVENRRSLYVPKGFAHGYQTLDDNTTIHYMVSAFYQPSCEMGIRWDDPQLQINWIPANHYILSDKDKKWPFYKKA